MSNSSSLELKQESNKTNLNYRLLLTNSEEWDKLAVLFHSQGWQVLKQLMQVERLQHLEVLADSDDIQQVSQHKAIARWIGQFFSTTAGIDDQLREEKRNLRNTESQSFNGSEFMSPEINQETTDLE